MSGNRKLPYNRHDRGYRLLFSHARTVKDLVRGFVREPWVEDLDFRTLRQLTPDSISGQLAGEFEERVSDVIWQVRRRGQSVYVVIILELQSTCRKDMALRMAVYVLLLYQRLVKKQPLKRGEKLPLILPIVFYNGDQKWWAPLDVADLIESAPESLAKYRPSMRYCLIDVKRCPLAELEKLRGNVAAGIVRAAQDHGIEYLLRVVRELKTWLKHRRYRALRDDLTTWLTKTVFAARAPDIDVPELSDLDEVETYLETNMQTWPEQWEARGRKEGVRVGRKEGEAAVLLRQITLKFGPPKRTLETRIKSADSDQLLEWAERVLGAETLDDIFENGAKVH